MNTGWGKTSHRFHLEFSSAFSLLSSLISRKNHAQTRRIDRRKLADFEPLIVSMGEKKRRFMLASKVSPRRENRPNYPLPSDLHFFPSLLRGWSWILIGADRFPRFETRSRIVERRRSRRSRINEAKRKKGKKKERGWPEFASSFRWFFEGRKEETRTSLFRSKRPLYRGRKERNGEGNREGEFDPWRVKRSIHPPVKYVDGEIISTLLTRHIWMVIRGAGGRNGGGVIIHPRWRINVRENFKAASFQFSTPRVRI